MTLFKKIEILVDWKLQPYQDAEITKNQGTGSTQITSGTSLGHVPEHTFSLWNKYEMNEKYEYNYFFYFN